MSLIAFNANYNQVSHFNLFEYERIDKIYKTIWAAYNVVMGDNKFHWTKPRENFKPSLGPFCDNTSFKYCIPKYHPNVVLMMFQLT